MLIICVQCTSSYDLKKKLIEAYNNCSYNVSVTYYYRENYYYDASKCFLTFGTRELR